MPREDKFRKRHFKMLLGCRVLKSEKMKNVSLKKRTD